MRQEGRLPRPNCAAVKIVQVVTRRECRGAQVFAAQLSDRLLARGHQVTLVGLYPPAPAVPDTRAEVVDLDGRKRPLDLRLLLRLRHLLGKLRPDVVQANGSDTLKYCSLACLFRHRLIYRNIGLASVWASSWGKRLLGRALLAGVDRVASVGEAVALDFARTYWLSPADVAVVPLAVDDSPALSRREVCALFPGLDPEGVWLMLVGSLTPEKNHAWLLKTLEPVLAAHPRVRCLFLGDGPLRRELEAGPRVHFLGAHPRAAEIVAAADIALLCSTTEGLPGVLLEAAAQGVPAVATRVGSVGEIVEDGVTGRLVEPGDRAAFARAVEELALDVDLRSRLGRAARERVLHRYSWDTVVTDFERLYASRKALGGGPSP